MLSFLLVFPCQSKSDSKVTVVPVQARRNMTNLQLIYSGEREREKRGAKYTTRQDVLLHTSFESIFHQCKGKQQGERENQAGATLYIRPGPWVWRTDRLTDSSRETSFLTLSLSLPRVSQCSQLMQQAFCCKFTSTHFLCLFIYLFTLVQYS